jgi:hypothetical protein
LLLLLLLLLVVVVFSEYVSSFAVSQEISYAFIDSLPRPVHVIHSIDFITIFFLRDKNIKFIEKEVGPTQPPIQGVPGALFLVVKQLGVKLTTHLHLLPGSKNAWRYISTPQYTFMAWCLVKKSTRPTLP